MLLGPAAAAAGAAAAAQTRFAVGLLGEARAQERDFLSARALAGRAAQLSA